MRFFDILVIKPQNSKNRITFVQQVKGDPIYSLLSKGLGPAESAFRRVCQGHVNLRRFYE
jgi:hypothetical protein